VLCIANREATNREAPNREAANREAANREGHNREAANREAPNREAANREARGPEGGRGTPLPRTSHNLPDPPPPPRRILQGATRAITGGARCPAAPRLFFSSMQSSAAPCVLQGMLVFRKGCSARDVGVLQGPP
jgi:hypothetical protein